MKQRSLFVIIPALVFVSLWLAVRGGAAQARSLEEVLSAPTCSPAITVMNANNLGTGSLRQAIADLCPGGTMTFNGDYQIILGSTLTIGTNMTIDGVGHTVYLDGNNSVTVMAVQTGATLSLQNIIIT
jgi:hypothetical protein